MKFPSKAKKHLDMSAGNIYVKLFYRILPCEKMTWDCIKVKDNKTIYARKMQADAANKSKSKFLKSPTEFWEFFSDEVFVNCSQVQLYKTVVEHLLDKIVKGCNGIIVGFGQTGTGKSFTLSGLELAEQDLGIVPQMLSELFERKTLLPSNLKMCIQISQVEFTNKTTTDLLQEPPCRLIPWENKNATKIKVTSMLDALELLYKSEGRRNIVETEKYVSHLNTSAVTIHVIIKNVEYSDPYKITSRFHIVDMAGCDILGNPTCYFKDRIQVAQANITKMVIEQFFLYLMSKKMACDKLKERMNPLIQYLDGDLTTQSDIKFIGHIKITKEDLPVTLSMLRFGQFVRGFNAAQKSMPPEENDDIRLELLEHQLEQMKKEKMQDSVLLNQNLDVHLSSDRIEHIKRLVQDYLRNGNSEISILNVAEAKAVFKIFKEVCTQYDSERKTGKRDVFRFHDKSSLSVRESQTVKPLRSQLPAVRSRTSPVKRQVKKPSSIIKIPTVDIGISVQSFLANQLDAPSLQATSAKKSGISFTKSGAISGQSLSGKPSKYRPGRPLSPTQLTKTGASTKQNKIAMIEESMEKMVSMMSNFVPEHIPDNAVVWEKYCNELSYKIMYEDYRSNEIFLRDTYSDYLAQIRKLQELRDIVEDRKNDLREAKMFKRFNVYGISDQKSQSSNNEIIISDAQGMCERQLKTQIAEMERQQEEVLKLQSLLKLFLVKRREIRKQMNNDFNKYCMEKFNLPMVPGEVLREDDDFMISELSHSESIRSMNEEILPTMGSRVSEDINRLKKLMHIERTKRKYSKFAKISWK